MLLFVASSSTPSPAHWRKSNNGTKDKENGENGDASLNGENGAKVVKICGDPDRWGRVHRLSNKKMTSTREVIFFVEYELELSNEYVRQYQSFVRFIEDNIIYLDGFG